MNQIKLTFGIGYFALNDNKYPKGLYIVSPQGNKLNITNVFTEKTISINLSQFVDSNNDPFATMDDLISQFNLAFNKGGGDGVGVVNEVDLLKNKTIFEKSVVEAFSTPSVFAWDNVNRSDTAVFSGAGNLDSGQAWQNLAGQNGNVDGNTVRLATTINQNAVLAFERTSFSSTGSVLCDFVWRGDNNTNGRFFIGKDADNGICFRIGIFTNSIIARIAGVETIINSNSISLDVSQANAFTKLRMSILLVRGGLSNKGYAVITFKDLNVSLISSGSGFDTAVNIIFSAASEVKYIGLQMSTSISLGVGVNNLKCFSI